MKISRKFHLSFDQAGLDFVDIDPAKDSRLYVDPYAFTQRNDEWSVLCHNSIIGFFQTAIDLIKDGHEEHAKRLLSNLHEPNETCLGVSRKKPRGRGVSGKQAIDLYDAQRGLRKFGQRGKW